MSSNCNLLFGSIGGYIGNRDRSKAIKDIKSYYILKISLKLLILINNNNNKQYNRSSLSINLVILIRKETLKQ